MPNAFAIAATEYDRPTNDAGDPQCALRYSIHAEHILRFLAHHRTIYASHLRRAFPDIFTHDSDARRHLRTLHFEDEVMIWTHPDRRRPNVYTITDRGLDHAEDFTTEAIPSSRDDPNGDHSLHELLITEVAVCRQEFFRTHDGYDSLWKMRFGFHDIPGFESFIPDYAELYRSPHGYLFDIIEVLSGERSITRVKLKMQKAADWAESKEGQEFLTLLYEHYGRESPHPVFRLLFIVHNRNLVGADRSWERQVLGATFTVPERLQTRIWTTTNAALYRAKSIDSPIWHCGAELVPHHARVNDPDITKKAQRKRIRSAIDAMRSYPLFTFTESQTA